MNSYKRDIRRVAIECSHLTLEEAGAYERLVDHYFLTEAPICVAERYEIVRARTNAEREATDYVVRHVFKLDGDVARLRWCDEQIAAWKSRGWFPRTIKSLRLPKEQWMPLRRLVFERDDFTCQYCGAKGGNLECDHIVPISLGGSNDFDNLTTACRRCNRSKSNKLDWSPNV